MFVFVQFFLLLLKCFFSSNSVHHDGEVSLEFLGDARGSVQISQSQSGVVGDGNLEPELEQELALSPDVVGDGPESLGNAGGSGQNCASQGNKHFVNLWGVPEALINWTPEFLSKIYSLNLLQLRMEFSFMKQVPNILWLRLRLWLQIRL